MRRYSAEAYGRATHPVGQPWSSSRTPLPSESRKTLGADKHYDTEDFVQRCRELNVTPHVAQNTSRRSSRIDERTTRHAGYWLSQYARKLIETVRGTGYRFKPELDAPNVVS